MTYLFLLLPLLILALVILVNILIIRAICDYLAKQNAREFDYDYLAYRTAKEICQRMAIIERQKGTAYKTATPTAEDQSTGNRDRSPEQDESRQE